MGLGIGLTLLLVLNELFQRSRKARARPRIKPDGSATSGMEQPRNALSKKSPEVGPTKAKKSKKTGPKFGRIPVQEIHENEETDGPEDEEILEDEEMGDADPDAPTVICQTQC